MPSINMTGWQCLIAFVVFFLYRYVRLVVNCLSHWTFKPMPIPMKPSYNSYDVTIVIPCLDGDGPEIRQTVRTCLTTNPAEVILVTIDANLPKALELARAIDSKKLRILSTQQANKRIQMCRAIPEVHTSITIFADDDVYWPSTILNWILAPFEDPAMGGAGTCQRLRRAENPTLSQRFWNFLGAIYLERRNFDISACTHMDGGVPCMSGRTVAYRTEIIQDDEFKYEFTHETWRTFQLNADDDNFITRWMVSHGWKTYVQYHPEAELRTTLEDNPKFLKQCLRWSRSNWRSNLTSMFVERHIWRQQPWSTYAVHLTTLTAWALPNDLLMVYLCYRATSLATTSVQIWTLFLLGIWIFITKWVKLLGHFVRYPEDLIFLPISIFFGYFHGLVKLYAALTLDVTTWGSRENADTDDAVRMIRLPAYS